MSSDPNLYINARNVAQPASIVGTDGEPPVIDQSSLWREWSLDDIYVGQAGRLKHVPKVNDWVRNTRTLERFYVESVNETTLVPKLVKIEANVNVNEMSSTEGRFFAGNHVATPCARQIFYDNSVAKPTLKIPSQFHVQGTTPHYAVAYRGAIAGVGGEAISIRYDENNTIIGHEIPLIPITQALNPDTGTKVNTQWILPDFYTEHDLEEGELITIYIYDDRGGFRGRTNFVVEYSALLRDVSDADKFISAISLDSFYIDSSDENNLLIPEQILKNSINLMGKVHYSDGSIVSYPIDGNKFELLYLDRASEAVASTKGVLVLKYYLGEREKSVHVRNTGSSLNTSPNFITRSFNYTIVERDGAYSVKLYPVPRWINASTGYKLDWYLFTLDRNQWIDVTNDVYITSNSPTRRLNGLLYGPLQQLNVAIDLGVINNTFKEHIHPQTVDIRLMRPASDTSDDRWYIGYETNQAPMYGEGLVCTARNLGSSSYAYNISNSCSTLEDFLDKVYRPSKPQFRTSKEVEAPKPNMFKIIIGTAEYEYPIRKWNEDLTIPRTVRVTDTVKVVFFTRYNNNDVFYCMSPLPVLLI